jgi:phosphosulfolactate phosphohydrolase-like enzyme
MAFHYRPAVTKHENEQRRAARRDKKAARVAERRAAKVAGVDIDNLPSDYQGLARPLAHGDGAEG